MVSDAIIVAAGYGSRLSERARSKPLARVCGMPLIEIGIRQALAAGIERVTVVTGHEADSLEGAVSDIGARIGIDIHCKRLDDWSRPNGWSVVAGAQEIAEPFLLLMADHIFGDGILRALTKQSLEECDVVLATDRVDNPLVDPEDATWVSLDERRRISRIGKTIEGYDAVDCGAFLATAALPRAICKAIEAGRPGSLSDGMQVLADEGRAGIMDIDGAWWIDVDDPRAHDIACEQARDHLAILEGSKIDVG